MLRMSLLAAKVTKTAAEAGSLCEPEKQSSHTSTGWSPSCLLVVFPSSASLHPPLAALRLRRPFPFHSRKVFEQITRIHQSLRFAHPQTHLFILLCKNRLAFKCNDTLSAHFQLAADVRLVAVCGLWLAWRWLGGQHCTDLSFWYKTLFKERYNNDFFTECNKINRRKI